MKHAFLRRTLGLLLAAAMLLGCFAMGASAAEGQTPFRVVSTFYGDSQTVRGFNWATKADAGSAVRIFEAGSQTYKDYEGASSQFQENYIHSAVAEELTPGTAYEYQVGDPVTGVWSEKGTFETNPGPGQAFTYIALADVQASSLENFQRGAAVLDYAIAENPDAAFQVDLGDFTNDSDNEQWDWYFEAFAASRLRLTLAPVAGNHDGNLKWNWFRNIFNLKEQPGSMNLTGTYYSFDYGDAHFAVLNTNEMYPMSIQQRHWLINDMKQSDAKWKILLMHRASYSAGKNINKPDTLIMRNVLLPIIEDCKIDLVMAGHDHVYYRSAPVAGDKRVNTQASVSDIPGYALALDGGGKAFSYTDPGAPIHIVPNTAGTKRYRTYLAMPPILDMAEECFQPGGPVYTTISIDGGTLTYKAFLYDEEAGTASLFDQVSVNKTQFAGAEAGFKPLSTSAILTLPQQLLSFFWEFGRCLVQDYLIKLLPQALGL